MRTELMPKQIDSYREQGRTCSIHSSLPSFQPMWTRRSSPWVAARSRETTIGNRATVTTTGSSHNA